MTVCSALSDTIGWISQLILNYQRKSVVGLSLEFQAYNLTGFLFYTVYCVVGYIEQQRLGLTHSIQLNDIAFAAHALFIQSLICTQVVLYKRENQHINRYHLFICLTFWVVALYNVGLSLGGLLPWRTTTDAEYSFNTVEFLGYVKTAISLVKYIPQAYMNWERQSTTGWSIGNVLLDITGGLFSFMQQFVDAKCNEDWTVFSKNVPKLLLAIISLCFDLIFITQHYVLYRPRGGNSEDLETDSEDQPYAIAPSASHTGLLSVAADRTGVNAPLRADRRVNSGYGSPARRGSYADDVPKSQSFLDKIVQVVTPSQDDAPSVPAQYVIM